MAEQQDTDQNKKKGQLAPESVAQPIADELVVGKDDAAQAGNSDADKNKQPPIRVIQVEPERRPEDELEFFERETLAINRDMLRTSKFTYRVAVFAFIAAAAAAVFMGVQVKIMSEQTRILAAQMESGAGDAAIQEMHTRRQLDIAQKQADALQGQLFTMRGNFRKEEAPFLWITNQGMVLDWNADTNQGSWTLFFSNYGKSPAKYIIDRTMVVGQNALSVALAHEMPQLSCKFTQSSLPQGKIDYFTSFTKGTTKAQWDDAMKHDGWIVTVGTFVYCDQSGDIYTTDFCQKHNANNSVGNCQYVHKIKKTN